MVGWLSIVGMWLWHLSVLGCSIDMLLRGVYGFCLCWMTKTLFALRQRLCCYVVARCLRLLFVLRQSFCCYVLSLQFVLRQWFGCCYVASNYVRFYCCWVGSASFRSQADVLLLLGSCSLCSFCGVGKVVILILGGCSGAFRLLLFCSC